MPLTLKFGDRAVAARLEAGGRVSIDNGVFTVAEVGVGLYRVDNGQRQWDVAVADDGESRWISVDGQVVVVTVGADGVVTIGIKLTIGGCPLRADIKKEVEERVGLGEFCGVRGGAVQGDDGGVMIRHVSVLSVVSRVCRAGFRPPDVRLSCQAAGSSTSDRVR